MTRRRHPGFEPLEDRRMLSVAPLPLDFGDPPERFDAKADTGAIHGSAYDDLNANGLRDSDDPGSPLFEPGVEGLTIFLDEDRDGVLDAGEVSTGTDVDGSYSFTGLDLAVEHTVRQVIEDGWVATQDGPVDPFQFERLIDVYAGVIGSDPSEMTAVDGVVYFAADTPGGLGRRLWQYDGTSAQLVADATYPDGVADPRDLTAVGGKLAFSSFDESLGRELWVYDPATETFGCVSDDVSPGLDSSYPADIVGYGNGIAFTVRDSWYGFVLNGIDIEDESGVSVSSAGDVNNDGYDDLIIGAWEGDPPGNGQAGESYVVFGGPVGVFPDELDLSDLLAANGGDGSTGFVLYGIDSADLSSYSVSTAGDINNDGYDDLIIAGFLADPGGNSGAGETYVVFGGAAGTFPAELNLADLLPANGGDGSTGFVLNGIDSGDKLGRCVSSAGDVNNDGYDDLIIGAYRADPAGNSDAGETYVVFGAPAGTFPAELDLSDLLAVNGGDGSTGFILYGIDSQDQSGRSVSSAGDINNDGYDDLIIGAYRADSYTGETYVVFGGPAGTFPAELDLSDLRTSHGGGGPTGFALHGIDSDDYSGYSVSTAGDVNNDGYADLSIGAYRADRPGNANAGETYVVFGGAAGTFSSEYDLSDLLAANGGDGSAGFVLYGINGEDYSGCAVSSAGDVNNDGYADLIIGAYGADPAGNSDAGETYVVFGGAAGTFPAELNLSDLLAANGGNGSTGFVLYGISSADESGYSVSSASDVNNDGYADLIIGAHRAGPGGNSEAGETYVVFGRPGFLPEVNLADLTGGRELWRYDLATETVSLLTGDLDVPFGRSTAPNQLTPLDGSLYFAAEDTEHGRVLWRHDLIAEANTLVTAPTSFPDGVPDPGELTADADQILFTANDGQTGRELRAYAPADGTLGLVTDDVLPGPAGSDPANVVPYDNGVAFTANDSSYGFVLNGIDSGDSSGCSVSTAGDVNNDGYDDLIIGAYGADPAGNSAAGETYVVFGGPAGTFPAELDLADLLAANGGDGSTGFVLYGIDSDDRSGYSVSSASDLNNDGYDDLIIGAHDGVDGGTGETYVVFGGPAGTFPAELDLSSLLAANGGDGTAGFVLHGIDGDDGSGCSVSSAGDVNNDGYDDLIIGADEADPAGRSRAGESYVVFGGPAGTFPAELDLADLLAANGGDGSTGFVLYGIDS